MRVRLGTATTLALALLASSVAGTRAGAATITFDLENQPGTSTQLGALTSLALTSSGLTMSLSRSGTAFDVVNTTVLGPAFPAAFGTRSLSPFAAYESNTPFVANFSSAVTGFSFSYGDFAGDPITDTDVATIQAYSGLNGTGTLLATATNSYGTQVFPTFNTFGVTGAGIQSVVFIGGSAAFPNSVYYDNFVVTTADVAAVPEPASLALVSIAGLAFAAGRKLVRKKAIAA